MRLALCLLFASLLTAQNNIYKISGTLVESGTNQPLPRVLVQIAPTKTRSAGQSVVTGADGTFSFGNLTPGKYSLSASRSNSNMQLYQGEEGFSTAIVVGPDLNSEGIVFPLQKSASLSGTVLDEEGVGLRGAQVHLYRQQVVSGRLEFTNSGMQVTTSSGHFRFGHLAGGTYYLAVQAHPWYAQNQPPSGNPAPVEGNNSESQQFDVAYPLTYYADAADPASATPITLAAGGTANTQITLHPVPAIHVRLPDVEMKPHMGSAVTVSFQGPGGQKIMANYSSAFIDGHQELMGLAPGRYEVSVPALDEKGQQHPGRTVLADLQNGSAIDFSPVSSPSISGRITFEGKGRPADPLTLLFRSNSAAVQAPVAADGTFQASAGPLSPGRYRLLLPNREDFVIQSVAVKGGRWKDGQLDVTESAPVQLSLVAAANTTDLDGMVLHDDKPVPGAMVLLLPVDSDRSDLIQRDQSDSDGTFTLSHVLPGRYRLLAIDHGHGLAYADPAAIKPYLASFQTVTVESGKPSPLKVNVQTRLP